MNQLSYTYHLWLFFWILGFFIIIIFYIYIYIKYFKDYETIKSTV